MPEGPLPYGIAHKQAAPLPPKSTYQHKTAAHHRPVKKHYHVAAKPPVAPPVAPPAETGKPLAALMKTELQPSTGP
jgi:hypothetical protein